MSLENAMSSQMPPIGVFDSTALCWVHSYDNRSKYKFVHEAKIPWNRVADFVKGEADNAKFPTSFKKYSHHHQDASNLTKIAHESWTEKIV